MRKVFISNDGTHGHTHQFSQSVGWVGVWVGGGVGVRGGGGGGGVRVIEY